MSEENAIVKIRMIMDGRKLLTGGTLAVSVASLAVGSVALATQPKVPETTQVEQSPIVIPLVEEKPTINPEEIHKWINDGADQTKREINEGREKELLDLREQINKIRVGVSVLSSNLEQTIKDINKNTDTFNKNFLSIDQKLKEALNKFAEKEAEYALWKAEIEEKASEIQELYTELKTIKQVSDWGTVSRYYQANLRDYIGTTSQMKDLIKRIKAKYPEFSR